MTALSARLVWAAALVAPVLGALHGSMAASSKALLAPRAPEGYYKLRLCNAFAWPEPLEMRRLQEPQLVEYPLPYKGCHDYQLPLNEGDQLQFRAGDLNIGTFSVKGLPSPNSLLLLVPHRRDPFTSTVSFESHIFNDAADGQSQVAVVDAYHGPDQSRIILAENGVTTEEELKFNTVVAVSPGDYQVRLDRSPSGPAGAANLAATGGSSRPVERSASEATAGKSHLKMNNKETYVFIRVGNAKGEAGGRYPEELIRFPQMSNSFAARRHLACPCLLLALLMGLISQ